MAQEKTQAGLKAAGSIAEIDAIFAERPRDFAMPASVAPLYSAHLRRHRVKLAWATLPPTVVVYNGFLIVDYVLMPASFWLAVILHMFVTLLILISPIAISQCSNGALRDAVTAMVPIAIVAQVVAIYALNDIPAADHYQYLVLPIFIYMNVIYRLEHRHTLIASLIIGMLYIGALSVYHHDIEALVIGTSLFIASASLTLTAHRRMEFDARRAFLSRHRDSLLRREAECEAQRDPLTRLLNRRGLSSRSEILWSLEDPGASPLAVVILDIDHFKSFNDRYGHLTGDTCLKRISDVIRERDRETDGLAARFGGEEFLWILPRTSIYDAVRQAERLRLEVEALAIPHHGVESAPVVTVSLGVAAGPVSAHGLDDLIRAADDALYAAKRAGRNQVWPPLPETAFGHENRDFTLPSVKRA